MSLSPKYFYDDLGSALFEAITRLPEYYLTRVERDLLATYGREIAGALDGPLELVELGSGSAVKTRLLIDAILERQPTLTYHPVDISADAVTESSLALAAQYDALRIIAYASDYFPALREKRLVTHSRVLALFLGSNIGNFEPNEARELLRLLAFSRTGALPITKASDRLQVHVTSVTHAIRRLEADGLVERIPHPTDGRTTLVQITELGRSTVEDATVTLNKEVFADIGMSDGDSRALAESIETLRRNSGDF